MEKCLHTVATLLVSVLMLPLFMQPAYANGVLDYQSTQTVDLINEHTDSQGLIVPVFDSFEDYQIYIDDFENQFGTDGTVQPRSFSCSATAALVPTYIWGQYDLLFSWSGNCLINCWSYTRLQVRHPPYIVSTTYYD